MVGFVSYCIGRRGPSGFGSASTAEQIADGISFTSQTAIVTGATSGVGYETARVLAKHGVHVVIPARKIKSAEEVRSAILKEFPEAKVTVGELDLSSLASVRKFVAEFKALDLPLNILINNAGIASGKFTLSPDGLELDFATNHMGHFLLVELLLDDMIRTATETGIEGRIVNVASEAHKFAPKGGIRFDKLNDGKSLSWAACYGQSKLANILHAKELSRRLQEKKVNITANALHPGTINTNLGRDFRILTNAVFSLGKLFTKSVAQGAATTVYVAVHPALKGVTGKYFSDCNEEDCTPHAKDMNLALELWNFSEQFIKDHNIRSLICTSFMSQRNHSEILSLEMHPERKHV